MIRTWSKVPGLITTFGPAQPGISRRDLYVQYPSVMALFDDALDYGWARYSPNAETIQKRTIANITSRFFRGYTPITMRAAFASIPATIRRVLTEVRSQIQRDVPLPTRNRRKMRRNQDWGDDLNADAIVSFNPACWDRMERTPVTTPFVRLGVNVSVSCVEEFDDLAWRGAAVLAMADHLIARGMNVEIVAYSSADGVSHLDSIITIGVVLKPAEAPLDEATAALTMCELAVDRMLFLPCMARYALGELSSYWGTAAHVPGWLTDGIDYFADRDAYGRDESIAWLQRQLAKADAQTESEVFA